MTPKVSVITPIYNVEKYLPRCLDSLIAQTLGEIEFICVNDGSTDGSLDILKSYASRDSRIVIIDKPNAGYGHTMNCGIDVARGEYIGIVESDDWIEASAFAALYSLAEQCGMCDIVKADYYEFSEGEEPVLIQNNPPELCGHVLSPLDDGAAVISTAPAIWAAIYRRNFLVDSGIRFLETPGASFQDTGFVYKAWIAADSFYLTPEAYLNYRVDNLGSSVKSAAKVFNVCGEFASIEQFLEARPERRERLIGRILAKKFDTYNWNYERIAWEFRKEFLIRTADEFSGPFMAGELDEAFFREREWRRLVAVLADPEGVYEADLAEHRRQRARAKLLFPVRLVKKAMGR